jgi:hypothetical protein
MISDYFRYPWPKTKTLIVRMYYKSMLSESVLYGARRISHNGGEANYFSFPDSQVVV